ncbi:MAG TPA: DUF2520 domain-containing protein [Chloroflexota bacterium]|nr:DUF2520 domain-containing protein [Chloroflexota bacterium]
MTIRTCSIVGTGVVASALGPALAASGVGVISVVGRTETSASRLARSLGAKSLGITDRAPGVDLIVLCVSDDAISEVAQSLRGSQPFADTIVAHTSGASRLDILEPVATRGARVGKMHPLGSLSGGADRLKDLVWGIEGSDDVLSELSELIQRLEGWPIDLGHVDLARYHLSAVFAANFAVGLLGAAADLWMESGAQIPAMEALLPLARGVLKNVEELGLEGALTGPIARGDITAVEAQIQEAARRGPAFERLFRALSLATADVAARRGPIDDPAIAEIVRILAENKVID